MRGFKNRNGFYCKTEIGESRSINMKIIENGRMELKDLLQDY